MNRLHGSIKKNQTIEAKIKTEGKKYNIEIASGARGKSAYDIWLEEGNTGSKDDFLRWLQNVETTYEELEDKPSIAGITLVGNKSFDQLGIKTISDKDIRNLL